MLLFVFVGSFLLRLAERTLLSLLFHEPPRNTPPVSLQNQISQSGYASGIAFSHPPNNFPISTKAPAAKRY